MNTTRLYQLAQSGIAALLVVAFMIVMVMPAFVSGYIPDEGMKQVLIAFLTLLVGYFFGSSAGSAAKTDVIAKQAAALAGQGVVVETAAPADLPAPITHQPPPAWAPPTEAKFAAAPTERPPVFADTAPQPIMPPPPVDPVLAMLRKADPSFSEDGLDAALKVLRSTRRAVDIPV